MWPKQFANRLESWSALREIADQGDLATSLAAINTWWFNAPWTSYHLHWDDLATWPDPWQLLDDNVYCEVARGLGILYTISMLKRSDISTADLVLTDQNYNLVLVNNEKYILNWGQEEIVNTHPIGQIVTKFTHNQVKQKYN